MKLADVLSDSRRNRELFIMRKTRYHLLGQRPGIIYVCQKSGVVYSRHRPGVVYSALRHV